MMMRNIKEVRLMAESYTLYQPLNQLLWNLLLEENKQINTVDYILEQVTDLSHLTVAFNCVKHRQSIVEGFNDSSKFYETYFNIYSTALETYRELVAALKPGEEINVDNIISFYARDLPMQSISLELPLATETNLTELFNHPALIVVRNGRSFVVIQHDETQYIIIDPQTECIGMLSPQRLYTYVTINDTVRGGIKVLLFQ